MVHLINVINSTYSALGSMGELISLLAIPAAAGAAWAGVRSGLNGARQSIAQIEHIVNRLDDKVNSHGERLASVETEAINLKERVAGFNASKK